MDIRFGAKDAPFIRTSGTKKNIRKFNHLPPILGVKWGGVLKMWKKNAVKFDYLGRYDRY
jgi:hypothetical protein